MTRILCKVADGQTVMFKALLFGTFDSLLHVHVIFSTSDMNGFRYTLDDPTVTLLWKNDVLRCSDERPLYLTFHRSKCCRDVSKYKVQKVIEIVAMNSTSVKHKDSMLRERPLRGLL